MIIVLNPSQLMNWLFNRGVTSICLSMYCIDPNHLLRQSLFYVSNIYVFFFIFFIFFTIYVVHTQHMGREVSIVNLFFFFLEELICYFLFYVDSWKTNRRSTHSSFRITDKITLILVKLPEFMGKNESNN